MNKTRNKGRNIKSMLPDGTVSMYSEADIAFVLSNYEKLTCSEIAEHIGRSTHSVRAFLSRRGVKTGRWSSPWDAVTTSFVMDNYKIMTGLEIAKAINKPLAAVYRFVNRHGLRKGVGNKAGKRGLSHNPLSNNKARNRFVRTIRGNFCMLCGYDTVTDVHHVDQNRQNNRVDNLIILCPNHHAEVHRGIISIDGPTLEHIGVA